MSIKLKIFENNIPFLSSINNIDLNIKIKIIINNIKNIKFYDVKKINISL